MRYFRIQGCRRQKRFVTFCIQHAWTGLWPYWQTNRQTKTARQEYRQTRIKRHKQWKKTYANLPHLECDYSKTNDSELSLVGLQNCEALGPHVIDFRLKWALIRTIEMYWAVYQGCGGCSGNSYNVHDDVIKWKHFPRNWPFVREIHRSPVNFPHNGQWHGPLMFSLIYAWINDWVNNREAGDLRRQHGHYDVIVMLHSYRAAVQFWKTVMFRSNMVHHIFVLTCEQILPLSPFHASDCPSTRTTLLPNCSSYIYIYMIYDCVILCYIKYIYILLFI